MQPLVTLGGMRAFIDDVRFIANESSGQLGVQILRHLSQLGIRASVCCGWTASQVHLKLLEENAHDVFYVPTFEEMREKILNLGNDISIGIFAAAVLDFLPVKRMGKVESSEAELNIIMNKTPKLVDLFRQKFTDVPMITFKLGAGITEENLIQQALTSNKTRQPVAIVANLKEKVRENFYEGVLLGPLDTSFWNHFSGYPEIQRAHSRELMAKWVVKLAASLYARDEDR